MRNESNESNVTKKFNLPNAEKIFRAEDIKLSSSEGTVYSLLDEDSAFAEVEFTFAKKVTRQTGTGYKDYYYRIVGSDDVVIVHKNWYSRGRFYDTWELVQGYYNQSRDYGARCREVAEVVGCPVELALAIGPDKVEQFVAYVNSIRHPLTKEDVHELAACGINRRKQAIKRILDGSDIAEDMGQVNSGRVADYLLSVIPTEEEQRKADLARYETAPLALELAEKIKAAGF